MRLKDHHALITGGGSGIGAATARILAAEGASLTLVGRRRELLEQAASTIRMAGGASIGVAAADVTEADQVGSAFSEAREARGPVTILVNNAGAAESAPFARVTPELWRWTFAINVEAAFACCQAALPDLLAAEQGRIVTVASTAALKGYGYSAPYVAAKHAALGLMRALAAEFAKTGLTANAVCPGFTDTGMLADAVANIASKTGRSEEEARAELARLNPQGRIVGAEEVAAAVLWLCLPESRSINGQAIAVAGGEVT